MTSQSGPRKEADNAIEGLRAQILARWRDEVRRDPEQAAVIHTIGDEELEDHLPGLTATVIKLLRGEPTETQTLEEDAAQHGHQRRRIGFSVVPLLREFQILRRILTDMLQEIIGANVPELFTMFFQTNEPAKTVKTGLGVGLALVKVLVELHGGTVNAHSEGQGKGAEFTVRLPMAASMPERARSQGRRVLVVDDKPDHLELLADLLRARGYEVTEARDASEALRVISDQKPHACVIDIGLPDMDGYELARKLREIPETRDSRLIAVTGYGTKADTHLFEEAGFDHYFPKPTNIEELSRAL